ncbi:AbrB/MazE/SpoVT family DNA-binding domain-containing protein [Bosea thiooxidans]
MFLIPEKGLSGTFRTSTGMAGRHHVYGAGERISSGRPAMGKAVTGKSCAKLTMARGIFGVRDFFVSRLNMLILDIHDQCISSGGRHAGHALGNSLAIRLPAGLVLKEGDDIDVLISGERIFTIGRDRKRLAALESTRRLRRPLPAGWSFDRDGANEHG